MSEFVDKKLTYAIIGAAMEVHRILGPGFLEEVCDGETYCISYKERGDLTPGPLRGEGSLMSPSLRGG